MEFSDPDCIISSETYDAALFAVGSVLNAVSQVAENNIDNAFCAVRPPGHHAEKNQFKGFCFFNNVALGAEFLSLKYNFKKILIFDFDVHHGNGTQHFFEKRKDILYISTHQHPNTCYPGTGFEEEKGIGEGLGYTVNITFEPGTDDNFYINHLKEKILPIIKEYSPDFIFLSAGFDAHYSDPLAYLNLSEKSFSLLTKYIKDQSFKSANGRIVSVLEGGYNLKSLGSCVYEHIKILNQD